MKTFLIYHENDEINREIIERWLASFSDLAGIIVLREKAQRMKTRLKREIKRVGFWRFLDVLAFRLYYKFFVAKKDKIWQKETIEKFKQFYPELKDVPTVVTHSPNSPEAETFLKEIAPDIVIALCKTLLKKQIFTLPRIGTIIFHPGICPEYRNAHGCFWALAEGDFEKVGMTLLLVDEGVDTGPTYGYYSYNYDALRESHIVIQTRVVIENLSAIQRKLEEICARTAVPLDVSGRKSNVWGQPWLTKYWKIKKESQNRFSDKSYHLTKPKTDYSSPAIDD